MKITKEYLRYIIKEELQKTISENWWNHRTDYNNVEDLPDEDLGRAMGSFDMDPDYYFGCDEAHGVHIDDDEKFYKIMIDNYVIAKIEKGIDHHPEVRAAVEKANNLAKKRKPTQQNTNKELTQGEKDEAMRRLKWHAGLNRRLQSRPLRGPKREDDEDRAFKDFLKHQK